MLLCKLWLVLVMDVVGVLFVVVRVLFWFVAGFGLVCSLRYLACI